MRFIYVSTPSVILLLTENTSGILQHTAWSNIFPSYFRQCCYCYHNFLCWFLYGMLLPDQFPILLLSSILKFQCSSPLFYRFGWASKDVKQQWYWCLYLCRITSYTLIWKKREGLIFRFGFLYDGKMSIWCKERESTTTTKLRKLLKIMISLFCGRDWWRTNSSFLFIFSLLVIRCLLSFFIKLTFSQQKYLRKNNDDDFNNLVGVCVNPFRLWRTIIKAKSIN